MSDLDDLVEDAHCSKMRLKHLLDASGELLDALRADRSRHPGDADEEKLVEIRVETALVRLRDCVDYIKKVT